MSNIYHSKIIQKRTGKENIHLTKMTKIKSLPNTYFSVIPKYLFFSNWDFCFTNIHKSQGCKGRGGHSINSSLPLPPASQTLRHQLGYYCRELTSARSQQPDSNQEPLVFQRKSLTTKLRALKNVLLHCLNLMLNSNQRLALFTRNHILR